MSSVAFVLMRYKDVGPQCVGRHVLGRCECFDKMRGMCVLFVACPHEVGGMGSPQGVG